MPSNPSTGPGLAKIGILVYIVLTMLALAIEWTVGFNGSIVSIAGFVLLKGWLAKLVLTVYLSGMIWLGILARRGDLQAFYAFIALFAASMVNSVAHYIHPWPDWGKPFLPVDPLQMIVLVLLLAGFKRYAESCS